MATAYLQKLRLSFFFIASGLIAGGAVLFGAYFGMPRGELTRGFAADTAEAERPPAAR